MCTVRVALACGVRLQIQIQGFQYQQHHMFVSAFLSDQPFLLSIQLLLLCSSIGIRMSRLLV